MLTEKTRNDFGCYEERAQHYFVYMRERERKLESFGDRIQYGEDFMRRWSRGRAAEAFKGWRWRYDMSRRRQNV